MEEATRRIELHLTALEARLPTEDQAQAIAELAVRRLEERVVGQWLTVWRRRWLRIGAVIGAVITIGGGLAEIIRSITG